MGSGDWWKEVKITASVKPSAASRAASASTSSARTGGGSLTTQGDDQASTPAAPGSSRAAAAPSGPARIVTLSQWAAMARMAGPVSSTSPVLSSLTARQRLVIEPFPARPGRAAGRA